MRKNPKLTIPKIDENMTSADNWYFTQKGLRNIINEVSII